MPSLNLRKAATAAETDEVLLSLLTIYVDKEPVLHLCDNTESIISKGIDFTPCAYKVKLPDQTDERSTCRLQIDNVDPAISKAIKENAVKHEITVDVSVILASTPDVYEQGPLSFILRNITINAGAITGELYDFYIHDRNLTGIKYTPESFPGMFY